MTIPRFLDERDVDALVEKCPDSRHAIIIIDGPSGVGKSELASRMVSRWITARNDVPTLVRMDDIYRGWDGLTSASLHIVDRVLEPRRTGGIAQWQRFDWVVGRPAEWNRVDPDSPLIVEGSGALSRASAALASMTVWLDETASLRKSRALKRTVHAFEGNWDHWAKQEAAFFRTERPDLLADVLVQSGAIVELPVTVT